MTMKLRAAKLKAAFLMAVAAVLILMPAPGAAQAQTSDVWSATLTVGAAGTVKGYLASGTFGSLSPGATFTYDGVDYSIIRVGVVDSNRDLQLILNKAIPDSLKSSHALQVDTREFALADATLSTSSGIANSAATWSNSGLTWSAGDTVSVSLTEASTTPTTTPTPEADGSTEYWSGTLTAAKVQYGFGCGFRTGQPQCDTALTDDDFMYHGTEYTIELAHVAYGETLQLILSGVPSAPNDGDGSGPERSRMALNVGSEQFLVKDAMISYGIGENNVWTNDKAWVLTWTGSGLSWSENARISLSLVTLPAGGL